jgi:uncharacterized membrane protein YkvA (DUF1232 family)
MKSAQRPHVEIELNPSEQRLYDRVRAGLVEKAGSGRSGLADLLLLMPDFVVLLARLLRDPRVARGDKAVALAGIAYVLSPIDLVPVFLFGPLGTVDDLLFVTAAVSRIVNHVHPDVVRHHWPGQDDVLDAIHRVSEWSERQLGQRVWGLIRRVLPG